MKEIETFSVHLTTENVEELLFFLTYQLEYNLSYDDLYEGLDKELALKIASMKKHIEEGHRFSQLTITGGVGTLSSEPDCLIK